MINRESKEYLNDFLNQLSRNNNRDWFQEHKDDYKKALQIFTNLVDRLAQEVHAFDSDFTPLSAKDYIFRIYRDVRFSKDKSPYKTHFGAFLAPGGKNRNKAGYYIQINKDSLMLGGGIYGPKSNDLKALRTEILFNGDTFTSILKDKSFVKYFGQMEDIKLVNPPRGFPKDHKYIELAKYKSFVCMRNLSLAQWYDDKAFTEILATFKAQMKFNRFLNQALDL